MMNLSIELQTEIDETKIALLIQYNWGEREVTERLENYSDEDIADILLHSNKDNWLQSVNDSDLLGYTSKEVIKLDENILGNGEYKANKINAESALNADEFIDTDSVTNTVTNNDNKDKRVTQEKYNINYNKLQADKLVKANNLWYNIAKDIVGELSLKIY